jgi:uncharacterized protein YcnI
VKHTLILIALLAAAGARAHVGVEPGRVGAGASTNVALRITHGCSGSPTHTLRVTLPAGFRGAKPMPKPGWTIAVRRAPLAEPYDSHGRRVTEDVVEITWRASTREAWLDDAHFDEFVLRGQAPAQPGALWFKLLQQCEKGQLDWSELPAAGTATRGLKSPAVLLEVVPAEAGAHEHSPKGTTR